MDEKKTRFVVYSDDYYGNGGRKILGHVNTLAEGQELLVGEWKKNHRNPLEYEKEVKEILSHTVEEFVGRDELTLYGSNSYFREGIARVPGFVEEEEKESETVTLGEIMKRELVEAQERKWEMNICDQKEKFYLKIDGCDKVFIGSKYEHIIGLPTHYIDNFYVYSKMREVSVSKNNFHGVDWKKVSVEEVDNLLRECFLSQGMYYSEEEAINNLPKELILREYSSRNISIVPYDKYGYHIMNICSSDNILFIHIRK